MKPMPLLPVFSAGLLTLAAWTAAAQSDGPRRAEVVDGVVHAPQRSFRIPLDLTETERSRVSAIRLYVSEDQGRTWVRHSDGPPSLETVTFRAERDGEYWFTITLVDRQGVQTPPDVRRAAPGLKVRIDTAEPQLDARLMQDPRTGRAGIRWTAADGGLDRSSIRLAVMTDTIAGWEEYPIRHPHEQAVVFGAEESFAKVQLSIADLAGNRTTKELRAADEGRFASRQVPVFVLDLPQAPPTDMGRPQTAVAAAPAMRTSRKPTRQPAVEEPSRPTAGREPSPYLAAGMADARNGGRVAHADLDADLDADASARRDSGMEGPQYLDAVPTDRPVAAPPLPPELPEELPLEPAAAFASSMPARKPAAPPLVMPEPREPAAAVVERPAPTEEPAATMPAATMPAATMPEGSTGRTAWLATRRIVVNYVLDESEAATPTTVSLWASGDNGHTWQMLGIDADGVTPVQGELPADGSWGLRVVVAPAGAEPAAPAAGTAADRSVQVDTVAPVISLSVGDTSRGKAVIRWQALDAHQDRLQVQLLIGSSPSGPWTPIAPSLENTGEHTWNFQRHRVQGDFHLRLVVTDAAGNAAEQVTAEPIPFRVADAARPGVAAPVRGAMGR